MSIWGKLLGGAAGFALGGPLGALLGAVAGHAVDRLADVPAPGTALPGSPGAEEAERAATRQIAFTIGVIVLGAKIAKADGVVSRSEVAAFKQVFTVPPEEEANVGRIFDQARRDARGFEPYAQPDRRAVPAQVAGAGRAARRLFHIAKADGSVGERRSTICGEVARDLRLRRGRFRPHPREPSRRPMPADPYNVLGVTRAMDNAAIKAAYRKLVRDSHPDRLIAKGMPPEVGRPRHRPPRQRQRRL